MTEKKKPKEKSVFKSHVLLIVLIILFMLFPVFYPGTFLPFLMASEGAIDGLVTGIMGLVFLFAMFMYFWSGNSAQSNLVVIMDDIKKLLWVQCTLELGNHDDARKILKKVKVK